MTRLVKLIIATVVAFLCWTAIAEARDPLAYRHLMPQPANVIFHLEDMSRCPTGPDVLACATPWTSEVFLGARPTRQTISHEIGHVYLFRAFFYTARGPAGNVTEWRAERPERVAVRERLARLLGFFSNTPWFGDPADHHHPVDKDVIDMTMPPPDERAADAYAACDLDQGPRLGRSGVLHSGKSTSYGYEPRTVARHRRVCAVLRSVA